MLVFQTLFICALVIFLISGFLLLLYFSRETVLIDKMTWWKRLWYVKIDHGYQHRLCGKEDFLKYVAITTFLICLFFGFCWVLSNAERDYLCSTCHRVFTSRICDVHSVVTDSIGSFRICDKCYRELKSE